MNLVSYLLMNSTEILNTARIRLLMQYDSNFILYFTVKTNVYQNLIKLVISFI